jgi:hypothetical protein
MGSFLENIVKNVDLGSVLGAATGGGLQDILGKLGGEAPETEAEEVETNAPEAQQEQPSLQDLLKQLTAGGGLDILGKLGGLATGSINVINIAKEALGGAMGKAAAGTTATGDDGFEEVS